MNVGRANRGVVPCTLELYPYTNCMCTCWGWGVVAGHGGGVRFNSTLLFADT